MDSSRVSSPDPLAMDSSALKPHPSSRTPRSTTRPRQSRSPNLHPHSSPSKSFIMDTGDANGASPWRIKVTVAAEPKDDGASSRKRARTVKVPLKDAASSSPSKVARGRAGKSGTKEVQVKNPRRKRSATPVRRKTRAEAMEAEEENDETDAMLPQPDVEPPSPLDQPQRKRRSTPLRHTARPEPASTHLTQTMLPPNSAPAPPKPRSHPTERSQRLSNARDELREALTSAVGAESTLGHSAIAPGDQTVTENEDFSMVSVESLRGAQGIAQGTEVSYMPSSPPVQLRRMGLMARMGGLESGGPMTGAGVKYPLLAPPGTETERQEQEQDEQGYDAMSWAPTGLAKSAPAPKQSQQLDNRDAESTAWRLERQAVSRRIQLASTSPVIVIDPTHHEVQDRAEDAAQDIWQDEASRSLEEGIDHPGQPRERSPQLPADQPLKPRRAKLPRTWRRSSGVDFRYSDSPAHALLEVDGAARTRASGGSSAGQSGGGGGGSSDGVLTPPSTEDEAAATATAIEDERADTSLAHNEEAAAASIGTALARPPSGPESRSPSSSSSSGDITSPDAQDTGLFWHANAPNVYQPEFRPRPRRPLRGTGSAAALVAEAGLLDTQGRSERATTSAAATRLDSSASNAASAQRQLQREIVRAAERAELAATHASAAAPRGSERAFTSEAEDSEGEVEHEDAELDYSHAEPERSYEERLNLDSPRKIDVRFNDSATGRVSLLAPREKYPALFDEQAQKQTQTQAQAQPARRRQAAAMAGAKDENPAAPRSAVLAPAPGLLSRLTTWVWPAIRASAAALTAQPNPTPAVSLIHTAALRRRYGVLPATHPWTYAHMRTLHRMLNSARWTRDSLVRQRRAGEGEGEVEGMHGRVAGCLMAVLVPAEVVEGMGRGEVAVLGDVEARAARGVDERGRAGGDVVFDDEVRVRGRIGGAFVLDMVGRIVWSEGLPENVERWEKRRGLGGGG